MKITLVSPSSMLDPYVPTEPKILYGIAYIAAILEKEGYQVSIWDRNVNREDSGKVLNKLQPDIIGISVMTGRCILDAIELSQKVKTLYPEIPIIWGGYHPTLLPDQTLTEDYIDYIVYGEGEYTMLDLAKSIERNSPIEEVKGIYYKKGSKILATPLRPLIKDLDELPFPAWHLFDMKKYIDYEVLYGRFLNLNTSRGCPFNCSFCCEPAFHKRRWRANSSRRVVEMLKFVKSEYKIDHVVFRDSLFTANLKRLDEICDGLIENKLNLHWHCPNHIQNWDKDLLKKMRRAGCVRFEFGVESGSPRILKLVNKRFTLEEVYDTFKKCHDVGIIPEINLMGGMLTETKEDFNMTMELLNRLDYGRANFFVYAPYPGTELHNLAVSRGLFTPPSRLRGWAKIADPYTSEFPPLGEISKDVLWEVKLGIEKKNKAISRRNLIRSLVQNPKKMMSLHFALAVLNYALRKVKK